jgi:NAD(P) transhydrogenase subunit alpha
MKIFVPNQTVLGETRVAMVPAVVKKLATAQVQVLIESGAGVKSSHSDEAYQNAGAQVDGHEAWAEAEIVPIVQPN